MKLRFLSRVLLASAAVIGLSTVAVAGVSARSAPSGVELTGAQRAQAAPAAGTYSGKVTKNTNAGLTIHGKDGDRTVVVQPGSTITRDGKGVNVSDLKTGDQATLTLAANGVVQSIAAKSAGDSAGFLKWLIPLIIVVLLLVVLAVWLVSRNRRRDRFVGERGDRRAMESGRTDDRPDNGTRERGGRMS